MTLFPHYTHIVNSKLKHIYLSFDDEGNLIIKSPKVTQKQIEQLLLKKSSWINKTRTKISSQKGKKVTFLGEKELYFLGKPYYLRLTLYDKKRTKLVFNGDFFTIYYSKYDESIFQKHIDNFYKNKAKSYIPPLVEKCSIMMNLQSNTIHFRKTKRQWGSCSSKNDLSFNTMMMKLPLDVIQYIIVHELAHIEHKHHRKDFWKLVEQYFPTYKIQVKELKNFTT